MFLVARRFRHTALVPQLAIVDSLETTIAAALDTHRPELERYVREQVRLALDDMIRELVQVEIAGRTNGTGEPIDADTSTDVSAHAKRCGGCDRTLPLAFYRDRKAHDGRRTRCRDCVNAYNAAREANAVPLASTGTPSS